MKKISRTLYLLLGLSLLLAPSGCQPDKDSPEALLKNVDAVQAMALANEWNWSKKEIKSYVNAREVVFELPGKKVIEIPLPQDKMLVAVAPYINQTHQ
jgi:hypothetical protein